MTVDCTQTESNISTLTDSVLNWSDANGIHLSVIPNNSVLNVETQNAVCILQDKSFGLVECVKDSLEIVPCDINNPIEDKEDKDYEDVLSVEMTDSWNIALNTNNQVNVEEPACITNSVTAVCLEINRYKPCSTKDYISIENNIPVGVMKTEKVSVH